MLRNKQQTFHQQLRGLFKILPACDDSEYCSGCSGKCKRVELASNFVKLSRSSSAALAMIQARDEQTTQTSIQDAKAQSADAKLLRRSDLSDYIRVHTVHKA